MFTISADDERAYTANVSPGTVSVLDLEVKKVLRINPISSSTQRIAISPDDKTVFTSAGAKNGLAVIPPTPDEKWLVVAVPRGRRSRDHRSESKESDAHH